MRIRQPKSTSASYFTHMCTGGIKARKELDESMRVFEEFPIWIVWLTSDTDTTQKKKRGQKNDVKKVKRKLIPPFRIEQVYSCVQ